MSGDDYVYGVRLNGLHAHQTVLVPQQALFWWPGQKVGCPKEAGVSASAENRKMKETISKVLQNETSNAQY